MKKILNYMLKSKFTLAISLLCAILSVFASLSAPIIIGKTIDLMVVPGADTLNKVIKSLVILIVIYGSGAIITWVLTYLTNSIAYKTANSIRNDLFDKINKLPIKFFDNSSHGDTISRFINDVDAVTDGMIEGVSTILTGIITLIGAVFFMWNINYIMAIVVLLSSPFVYFVARFITINSQKMFKEQAKELGSLNGYIEEMITGHKTVKAFNYQDTTVNNFKDINSRLYDVGVKSQFYGALANPSTRLVNNITFSIIGIVGSIIAMKGIITVGDISSFLIYSSLFGKPINEITSVLAQIQSAVASINRVYFVFEQTEEEPDSKNAEIIDSCEGEVEFRNVSFSYNKGKRIIDDLSFKVKPGTRVAIVGKTGCGKTTLVNLLMRFYNTDDGEILIDGKTIMNVTRQSLRHNFGMVLQETYVFTDTIANNISYGHREFVIEKIEEAAKKTGAHSFIRRLPKGYNTVVSGAGGSLSKGQEQLLTISRVMLIDPPMLILDEATSNIDTRLEIKIQDAFEKIMKGRTSFVIAHRLSTIKEADIIFMMDSGKIIEKGSHDELLAADGAYKKLYYSQFAGQET